MGDGLLAGVRVVDLAGEPAAMAGRVMAELGADVTKVERPGGDPLRAEPVRYEAWTAGKTVVEMAPDDPALAALLAASDAVITTPGWPGVVEADRRLAPGAVWVSVTPFGLEGPRSAWRASDLGVMASSGNMFATGDRDRPPVRCTEPSGYAHVGPETAFAALTALASGRPQHVDLSMQEVVLVAGMCAPARFAKTGFRGRRSGAAIGRTREIWPCADGFVSFGLRGGRARLANLRTITRLVAEAGIDAPSLSERDWEAYDHNAVPDDELRAIEEPIAAYFATRTMAELYEVACTTNLMLAPANSPKEIYASAQLAAREFFADDGLPRAFVRARVGPKVCDQGASTARLGQKPSAGDGAWAGTRIVEFGAGAAGPIATRYFAEHGATVVRVESRSRPDFLRTYALGPNNPHGLEGSDMFDGLNVGKLGITLNLKHPDGVALARRLIAWAGTVTENFAPRAMRSFGLDYATLAADQPDLVMLSACLQGQTGPHRDYPGFGGQGSALSGYNFLTGWPDRLPLGPAGTITDSLAPRFSAAALAAALLHRRRTGLGAYLDLSQVEAAIWSLSPWVLDFAVNGRITTRDGNRSSRAVLHGAFPCAGDERWVVVAAWDCDEWAALAKVAGIDVDPEPAGVADLEAAVAGWTSSRSREEVAEALQDEGLEAVPVADYGDVFTDPQLAHRGHFVRLHHPVMGEGHYERNGFRLSGAPAGYERTSPTLGQHNEFVLGELLGLSSKERRHLADRGALD